MHNIYHLSKKNSRRISGIFSCVSKINLEVGGRVLLLTFLLPEQLVLYAKWSKVHSIM